MSPFHTLSANMNKIKHDIPNHQLYLTTCSILIHIATQPHFPAEPS